MSQRKNSLVLSQTAIAKLNSLVQSGTYATIEDAANHIITTALTAPTQTIVSGTNSSKLPETTLQPLEDDSPLAKLFAMDFNS